MSSIFDSLLFWSLYSVESLRTKTITVRIDRLSPSTEVFMLHAEEASLCHANASPYIIQRICCELSKHRCGSGWNKNLPSSRGSNRRSPSSRWCDVILLLLFIYRRPTRAHTSTEKSHLDHTLLAAHFSYFGCLLLLHHSLLIPSLNATISMILIDQMLILRIYSTLAG